MNEIQKELLLHGYDLEYIALKDGWNLYYNDKHTSMTPNDSTLHKVVEMLQSIEHITFREYDLIDISFLRILQTNKIKSLDLTGNRIKDISIFKELDFTLLEDLYLRKNNIKNLVELNLPNLKYLSMWDNPIKDYNPRIRSELPKLNHLYFSCSGINERLLRNRFEADSCTIQNMD